MTAAGPMSISTGQVSAQAIGDEAAREIHTRAGVFGEIPTLNVIAVC